MTITGIDLLFGIAAYALFRYVKDYFDRRRALNEVKIAKQQERLIAALIKDGFTPDQAQGAMVELLKQIVKRGADDPVMEKVARFLGK